MFRISELTDDCRSVRREFWLPLAMHLSVALLTSRSEFEPLLWQFLLESGHPAAAAGFGNTAWLSESAWALVCELDTLPGFQVEADLSVALIMVQGQDTSKSCV